jgi:hypothetical protein
MFVMLPAGSACELACSRPNPPSGSGTSSSWMGLREVQGNCPALYAHADERALLLCIYSSQIISSTEQLSAGSLIR